MLWTERFDSAVARAIPRGDAATERRRARWRRANARRRGTYLLTEGGE